MIACSKPIVVVPFAPATSSWLGEVNLPTPWTTWTLRCLARPASPPVRRPTTPSFQSASLSRSISGLPNAQAVARHLARLGDHLGGVQQRLGRDAADVQADPAERRIALDQHHLLAEIGGAERRGVAARPRAQHQHLGLDVALARPWLRRRRRLLRSSPRLCSSGCFGFSLRSPPPRSRAPGSGRPRTPGRRP